MKNILKSRLFIVLLIAVIIVSVLVALVIINHDSTVGPAIACVSWADEYDSFEELTSVADLIVVGSIDRVIAETSEGRWWRSRPFSTDFSFNVDSILKGAQVTRITIHQMGAAGELEVRDDPLFSSGERYILFLREYESGKWAVLGGPQGRFMVVGDQVYSMNNILPDRVDVGALEVNGLQKEVFIDSINEMVAGSQPNFRSLR